MIINSFCRICEPCCSMVVEVADDKVVSILPDRSHPVNKGFACHKGVNYLDIHNDPDRLDHPLKRVSAKNQAAEFIPHDWDSTVAEIAEKLKQIKQQYGKNSIACYRGNQLANNSISMMGLSALIEPLGVDYVFSSATQDASNKLASSEEIFGSGLVHTQPDFENTHFILSFGANPKVSHMSFVHSPDPIGQFRKVVARGGTVKFVDPRKNESCSQKTGDVVLVKPDTDLYFMAAILHEIVFHIGFNTKEVESKANNIQGLIDFVKAYPAERVAPVIGIESILIKTLAQDFCAAKSASIYMSTGVNMGQQGTLAYWLLNMISLFSGNLGKAGGNVYRPGFFSMAEMVKKNTDDPWFDTEFGDMRKISGYMPGNLMPDFIESEKEPVRALIVLAGNPLLSVGGEARFRDAFQELDLLVVVDIYRNATAEYADYVLPATDWLEREDINLLHVGMHVEPYVQYAPSTVEPRAERKPEWWMLARIAQAMGQLSILDQEHPDPIRGFDPLLEQCGMSVDKLKTLPSNTYVLPKPELDALFTQGIQHADKKLDCYPELFTRQLERVETIFEALSAEPKSQLKLITLRTNYMHNTWLHNVEKLKRGKHVSNPAHINPSDAKRLGLADGDEVEVSNPSGKLIVAIEIDSDLKQGVIAITHGWGHEQSHGMSVAQSYPGVNANLLAPSGIGSYEIISNQAQLTGINVDVRKCEV